MRAIRCIAIDDEPLALTILGDYASRIPVLDLIATFTNPAEASDFIIQEKPDLLFLDIQMPEIRGLDFIRTLQHKPLIILTTAYAEYALQGYNLDVTDYLLKPIPFERFLQAVNKAMRLLSPPGQADPPKPEKDYLFVKSGYKSVKVNFSDIIYIEGMREYVTIYTSDRKLVRLDTMKNMESILPEGKFIRIHKSYIVNLDHVKSYYGNVIETILTGLPVGRAYKEKLGAIFS